MSQSDFHPTGYRQILQAALERGYRITSFRDYAPPTDEPVLLLRHDLDHCLRSALVIAQIEHELQVSSTYFVQVACPFYNLLSPESRGIMRRISALGHEVGLHYETDRYLDDAERRVRLDCALLEDLSGQPVLSASQHLPSDSGTLDIGAFVANDAYAPEFTLTPLTYISDSLMQWRQATPQDLLRQDASFQLLCHPMKWAHEGLDDMSEALARARDNEIQHLREEYAQVEHYYGDLLERRAELDARFRARRHGA